MGSMSIIIIWLSAVKKEIIKKTDTAVKVCMGEKPGIQNCHSDPFSSICPACHKPLRKGLLIIIFKKFPCCHLHCIS